MSKDLPDRKWNRLHNFNYSQNGLYFVTICVKYGIKNFGEIKNEKMILNKYGQIANEYWQNIPKYFNNIKLDEYIIMPNHIHGIIIINNNWDGVGTADTGMDVGTAHVLSLSRTNIKYIYPKKMYNKKQRRNMLLSKSIHGFKSSVTRKINQLDTINFQWQRSFHDHIIRDETSLNRIRKYIKNNPHKWGRDRNKRNDLWM